MKIQKFIAEKATKAHGGTILASAFVPEGVKAPFGSAWGFLEDGKAMEPHSHGTMEIYVVIRGKGVMGVAEEEAPVGPGDVIEIPPNAMHTLRCTDPHGLLWAALWWEPL